MGKVVVLVKTGFDAITESLRARSSILNPHRSPLTAH